jgi:hypothetical protein
MGKTNLWHDDIRKPNNIGWEKAGACVIQEWKQLIHHSLIVADDRS